MTIASRSSASRTSHAPGPDPEPATTPDAASTPPAFLTQADVAALLHVPVRTLEDWRLTRSGPPFLKLGRHVRYELADVLTWARSRRA